MNSDLTTFTPHSPTLLSCARALARLIPPIIIHLLIGARVSHALRTNDIELGLNGNYDGTVHIRRDAEGRMTFEDNQIADPVTLLQLLHDSGKANLVTVAGSGGEFNNLVDAYDAVPVNGIVLVYPGEYTMPAPLILGAKGCSFIAFDARATTLTLAEKIGRAHV